MTRERLRATKIVALLTVSVLATGFVISTIGFSDIVSSLRRIRPASLGVATILLLGSAFFAALRLHFVARDMGHNLALKDSLVAFSIGQLAGSAFVQFFGQILARSALLARKGISSSSNIAIAIYERFLAAAISVGLALSGALFLFGEVEIDTRAGGDRLILLASGIMCALTFGYFFGWGKIARPYFEKFLNRKSFALLSRNALITLIVQLSTAAAYVVIAKDLSPGLPASKLFAASLLVMFAASLPISFGGWGIRELSAVFALKLVGVDADVAVATALTIGTFSLAALLVLGASTIFLPRSKRLSLPPTTSEVPAATTAFLIYALPIAATTAVFFQVFLPMRGTAVNVNLADPIAVLGGGLFVFALIQKGNIDWRVPNLMIYVLGATAAILLSFSIGYFRYGWIDWAFMNKLCGWFVLLMYAATGALLVNKSGLTGFTLLARTFVSVAASIVILAVIVIALRRLGFDIPRALFSYPLEGFSQNRNAFGFVLLFSAILAWWMKPTHQSLFLGILFCGLWLTGSRSALGSVLIVQALAVALANERIKTVLHGVMLACAIIGVLQLCWYAGDLINGPRPDRDAISTLWILNAASVTSDTDRFKSMLDGLGLFSEHILFGAGLGAYVAGQPKGAAIIIHSTPIWLLAEMGIVGLLAFAIPAARIIAFEAPKIRENPISSFVVFSLVGFGIMSTVHELLYQRSLWLMLGAAFALPANRPR